MSKRQIDQAMRLNNSTFNDYYCRLKLLAISLFEWEGLDEIGGCTQYLEKTLFKYGRACFVKDKKLGYLSLQAQTYNYVNVYNLPTQIVATGMNYNETYTVDENCVYIQNNYLETPTDFTITLIAMRLYEIQRTIDTNINTLKTPIIIEGSAKQALTLQNLLEQYSGNVPLIFGNKNFNIMECLKAINLNIPYNIDKLEAEKTRIWQECLTFLGINNANTDKKERLITDEVNSNDELIKYYLNCFLKPRQEACKKINNMFFKGKEKIKVNINKNVLDLLKKQIDDIIEIDNLQEVEDEVKDDE